METGCLSPSVPTTLQQNVQQFNHPLFMKQKAVPSSLQVELITLSGLRHVLALSPGKLLSASELFLIFTQFRYNNRKLECSFNFCKTEQHRSSVNQLTAMLSLRPRGTGKGHLRKVQLGVAAKAFILALLRQKPFISLLCLRHSHGHFQFMTLIRFVWYPKLVVSFTLRRCISKVPLFLNSVLVQKHTLA